MYPSLDLLNKLQGDLARDLLAFLPEVIISITIVSMLLLRLFSRFDKLHLHWLALTGSLAALGLVVLQWSGLAYWKIAEAGYSWQHCFEEARAAWSLLPVPAADIQSFSCFTGLVHYDSLTVYIRLLLLVFLALVLILTLLTGLPDRSDSADFGTLIMGSTLGMMLMGSAVHLMMIFIAIEMASVPSYVLAGFLKGKKRGSEAALKYVVYGASASGVMLYGISLLVGKFGTGFLPDLSAGYRDILDKGVADPILVAGTVLILIGLCFKLAVVPFHFWLPDVFEGASAEVGAFLSVASKAAALVVTMRFVMGLAGGVGSQSIVYLSGSFGLFLAAIAATTATLGNLAALAQSNLKRMLGYSTIAHAGYMLMAMVPMMAEGSSTVAFYLIAYLFMNLGAFAVVAFLRNQTGSEDLSAYAGMIHRSPLMVICLAIFLLSLLGLPPLAGFAAKFQIFAFLYKTSQQYSNVFPIMSYTLIALLILAGLNTVISAGFYLRVLRVMILEAPPAGQHSTLKTPKFQSAYVIVLAGAVILSGIFWNQLSRAAEHGLSVYYPEPAQYRMNKLQ